jgi:hypothetical protein
MRSVILLLSTEPSYGLIKMLPDISLDLGALKPCECDPLLTTTQCNYCLDGRNLCLALIAGHLFKKHPIEAPEPEEIVAAEIRRQRE